MSNEKDALKELRAITKNKECWKENTDNDATTTDDEADATVEESQHRHHLVDFLAIVLLEGLVQEIHDASANAKFGNAKETHDVHEHTRQANKLSTKAIEEYFTGKEGKKQ